MRFAGWYCVAVGVLMLAVWGVFLAMGQVPELATEPYRIGFHLAGEGVTALALAVSGAALLRGARWARSAALVALGMLLYTALVSPGYFAQGGAWPMVGVFAALLALAAIALRRLWRDQPGR